VKKKPWRLPGGGNLCEQEPHGRNRHETRPSGCERSKASRGRENLKALHSWVRKTQCWSLLVSRNVEGAKNPMEGQVADEPS
jgi:hypothetical protein